MPLKLPANSNRIQRREENELQYLQQHTNNVCFAGEAHEVVKVKTEAGEGVLSEERGPHLPFALCCERACQRSRFAPPDKSKEKN